MKVVRLTEASDSALGDINQLLRQLVHDVSTYEPVSLERFNNIIINPQTLVVVARDGARIVGVGILFSVNKFRGIYGYIEDMIVDETYRGQGLGQKILEELINLARAEDIRTIELSTRPSRVPANNLYKKLGFEHKETNVYRLKL